MKFITYFKNTPTAQVLLNIYNFIGNNSARRIARKSLPFLLAHNSRADRLFIGQFAGAHIGFFRAHDFESLIVSFPLLLNGDS